MKSKKIKPGPLTIERIRQIEGCENLDDEQLSKVLEFFLIISSVVTEIATDTIEKEKIVKMKVTENHNNHELGQQDGKFAA